MKTQFKERPDIAGEIDLSRMMVENNIGKIERYPGGWFTVALMNGAHARGRSVGEAYQRLQEAAS